MSKLFQRNKLILLVFTALLGSSALMSCLDNTSCGENTDAGLIFTFYKVTETNGQKKLTRNNDNVVVFESGNLEDTVYAYSSEDTLRILPLQLNDTITSYVFKKDSVMDQVEFYHTLPEAGLIDMNCGFTPIHTLTSGTFTNNYIDSIYIVYPEVSNDIFQANVYIFY